MATRIQLRRGTASSWTSNNPILASGEIGIETDTNLFKIGNGSADWEELPYFLDAEILSASSSLVAYIDGQIDALVDLSPETLDTLNELAAAINDDPNFFTNISATITSASAYALSEAEDYIDSASASLITYVDSEILSASSSLVTYTNDEISSASASLVSYTNSEISSASSSLIDYTNSASSSLVEYTNSEILSASANLISYTDSEISSLEVFSNIVTNPETETIEGDSNSDTLTFDAGSNIILSASASTDTLNISLDSELTGIDSISTPKFIEFNTSFSPSASLQTGSLYWHEEHQTLHLSLENEVSLDIGQEEHYPPVINNSGVQINRGELVMVTGVQGDKLAIAKAVTDGTIEFDYIIGIAAHDIPDSSDEAVIIKFGYVNPFNTDAYSVGTILYPDPTVNGGLTDVKPNAPGYKVPVAIVTKQGTGGKILVRINTPSTLGESDSNVEFTDLQDEDILVYNNSASIWENESLQDYLTSASAAAFASASAYTDSEISSLTTDNIPEPTVAGDETFTITNNGSGAYVVDSVDNPTFDLVKGNTYTFIINASGHPFWIQSASGAYSPGDIYSTGTTNLGTDNGTITWTIPLNAPSTLYYACQFHSSMQGTINLIDPGNLYFTHERTINAASVTFIPLSSQQSIINSASAAAVTAVLDGAPGALDTLNELAAALGDDENFATSVTNSLAAKLDASAASATYLTQSSASSTYSAQGHTHLSSDITDFDEASEDAVSSLFIHSNHTNITATYDDESGEIILVGSAGGGSVSGGGASIIVSASAPAGAVEGDAWFKSTDGSFYVFDGTFWVETASDGAGSADMDSFTRWNKTYSGSATLIEGTDEDGIPLIYTPGLEQLFINGILIDEANYTATSGSTIVLSDAVLNNDVVEIFSIRSFNIANVYTKEESDAKYEENITFSSSEPSNPSPGTLWLDSTNTSTPILKVYNGTSWIAVSGGDSGLNPLLLIGA